MHDRIYQRFFAFCADAEADAYDHLEYNRPKTEAKPNYFRLDSTLSKKKT